MNPDLQNEILTILSERGGMPESELYEQTSVPLHTLRETLKLAVRAHILRYDEGYYSLPGGVA